MNIYAVVIFVVMAVWARAGDLASTFAFVMIDDESETRLGDFPYDRAMYAKAIDACARAKAKGVVLKFFLDRPKSVEGDNALGVSMRQLPVVLQ